MVDSRINKAVLFDLDGVLVDACDWHYEALNNALEKVAHYRIPRDEHMSTYNGIPTKVKLGYLVDKGIIAEGDIQAVYDLKQELTVDVVSDLCHVDESKIRLMEKLRRDGFKIGCVTNSIRETARLMLEKSGVLEYMDCVISNEDVAHSKPHVEGYIKAMVALGAFPENTAIVEDSPRGLEAARATGCRVIEVRNATEVDESLFERQG